jgi:hypothetical protein
MSFPSDCAGFAKQENTLAPHVKIGFKPELFNYFEIKYAKRGATFPYTHMQACRYHAVHCLIVKKAKQQTNKKAIHMCA